MRTHCHVTLMMLGVLLSVVFFSSKENNCNLSKKYIFIISCIMFGPVANLSAKNTRPVPFRV